MPPNVSSTLPLLDDADDAWIRRRLPVWVALSELFGDTELPSRDLAAIADVIRAASFTRAEAEAILMREVAPVFVSNLMSVAGEWAGWPEAVVRDAVLTHLRSGPVRQWLARVTARTASRLYRPIWDVVAGHLGE